MESGFVVFKESIAKPGSIIFDHVLTEELSCFNKNLNQDHKYLITGRRTNIINQKYIAAVLLHKLSEELWYFLVTAGLENAKIACKSFDDALFRECESQILKEKFVLEMKCTASQNELIFDFYFRQQYHYLWYSNTPGGYFKEYDRLGRES